MGEIFRLVSGLSLISSQFTNHAYPWLTFSRVSVQSFMVGSGCRADGCAPLERAASIRSMLHSSSMVALQPLVANSSSMGAAGWSKAGPCGATAYGYLLWSV